jgi:flagellar biosynthesis protein FlhF
MEQVEVTGPALEGTKIWAFIGPTGVGKTTTLVKLAAHFSLRVTKKITLITIDTYRIGGIEQLKTYAEILRLPFEVAHDREELRKIIEKNIGQDFLFIDTVGRNPNHVNQIEELKDFLTVHPRIENHLLLSSTTKEKDLRQIIQSFSLLPIRSYIFTKIDETEEYGPLLNQLFLFKQPLSYLTNGQRVPEDIELATKVKVANLVMNQIQWN